MGREMFVIARSGSDEAIHLPVQPEAMDCFASLAMTLMELRAPCPPEDLLKA
jgi:hypothetical protein